MKFFQRIFEPSNDIDSPNNDIIILHGLLGMSDNWLGIAKGISKDRKVIIPDLRNHGQSMHHNEFSLKCLVNDLDIIIKYNFCRKPILIGHSLGARIAMQYALDFPEKISKLIIIDMNLRQLELSREHINIFNTIESISLQNFKKLKEIELHIKEKVDSERLTMFILKNIRKTKDDFHWKINIDAIKQGLTAKNFIIKSNYSIETPTLLVYGENSSYINTKDIISLKEYFKNLNHKKIPNAGHWVQVDNFPDFKKTVLDFL